MKGYFVACTVMTLAGAVCFMMLTLQSCAPSRTTPLTPAISYERIRDSLGQPEPVSPADTVNIFDNELFIPGRDPLDTLLKRMDLQWTREASMRARLDTLTKRMRKKAGYSKAETDRIRENLRMVEEYLNAKDALVPSSCEGPGCILFAVVDKRKQLLFLHLFGRLSDSFPVSTGLAPDYETPAMSLHPRGPLLVKYSSRKFPGGDYMGLGNMPYAVFLDHGYAIHGTTPGNFSKLGKPASHGCIRLHPDHAKLFHALVKAVGLRQTWVTISDSWPMPVTTPSND